MSLRLHAGMSRKIGQRDYGSLGASCEVQLELPDSLLFDDPAAFQQRVRQAYAACERAVDEQLGVHQGANGSGNGHVQAERPDSTSQQNGNGSRLATEKQITYARQLAGRINGLGVRNLETLAQKMFGKPLAGLSSMDASAMIDRLKDIKEGAVDVQDALNAGAA